MLIYDITNPCNKIAETFFDKTIYNGCIITLRLCKNSDECDSFYHLVYYARSNYKLVIGMFNDKPFFSEKHGFEFLSYHDSCWRYDSYKKLEKIVRDGNFRKVEIHEITPMQWKPIEFSISGNYDSVFSADENRGEGTITVKE